MTYHSDEPSTRGQAGRFGVRDKNSPIRGLPEAEDGLSPVLGNGTAWSLHRFQPLRKLIPPRSRDQQPFLGPRHPDVEEFHVLGGLGFRGFDLAEADEDHGAELKALAALHGEDVDLGFPGIVGPLASAGGHEQMGDAERLELMGDPFSMVRLHGRSRQ